MNATVHIRYCRRCIMPETKPDLFIDAEGVCNACRSYERRQAIDWTRRGQELMEILDRYRSTDKTNYDCIVPVSGGKDSTYQTLKMLELGMNPLCINSTTDQLSPIGRRIIPGLRKPSKASQASAKSANPVGIRNSTGSHDDRPTPHMLSAFVFVGDCLFISFMGFCG